MKNAHGQIICENDNIILNDGVTILHGYLELSKKGLRVYNSIDPNNKDPRPGILKRRNKDDNGNSLVSIENAPKDIIYPKVNKTLHFCKLNCFHEWIEREEKLKAEKKLIKKTKKK